MIPVTNIAAMRALFPAVAEAATLLKVDSDLVSTLRSAAAQLPEFPFVRASDRSTLVSSAAAFDDTIIAESYDPAAPIHNIENPALEPVWPYALIGDDGPMHEIAVRTFMARRNQNEADWSFDPIQAARLGLAGQVKSSLRALTTRYQLYPSGLAKFFGDEFYVEQIGVLTAALHESLVAGLRRPASHRSGLARRLERRRDSCPSPRRKGPRPDNKRSTPGLSHFSLASEAHFDCAIHGRKKA